MSTIAVKLTDPANELAELFLRIKNHSPKSSNATYSVLAEFIGVDHSSPILYEVFGIIAQRTNDFREFVSNVQDEFIDDDMRGALVSSVRLMIQILNPASFAARWDQVQQACLERFRFALIRWVGVHTEVTG